jgi:hypothetical protein
VLGIGGHFLRARGSVTLSAWYRERPGLDVDADSVAPGGWPNVFATFDVKTDYFGSRTQLTTLNVRVRDLDTMLAQPRAARADVADATEDIDSVGRSGCSPTRRACGPGSGSRYRKRARRRVVAGITRGGKTHHTDRGMSGRRSGAAW